MYEFGLFVGIDFSGAETPGSRLKALQVYAARPGLAPEKQAGPSRRQNGSAANWTRAEVAEWLIGLVREDVRFIAGIDHAFSFPQSYFDRYRLKSWPEFLNDFGRHWPTDREHMYVSFVLEDALSGMPGFDDWPGPGLRVGKASEFCAGLATGNPGTGAGRGAPEASSRLVAGLDPLRGHEGGKWRRARHRPQEPEVVLADIRRSAYPCTEILGCNS